MNNILITGACGQVGTDLTAQLLKTSPGDNITCLDLTVRKNISPKVNFIKGDILNKPLIKRIIQKNNINIIYHLASLLSVNSEKNIALAWQVNVEGLRNVLEIIKTKKIKLFWPSSIAVFGPSAQKENSPQKSYLDPITFYGTTKVIGEQLIRYYVDKFRLDVRSLRYPGVISHTIHPVNGTTDFAVDMYYHAVNGKNYISSINQKTKLPFIYINDVIKATQLMMEMDKNKIDQKLSYNLIGLTLSPDDIYHQIKKFYPEFMVDYKSDFRQSIADSWPESINDKLTRQILEWNPEFNLSKLTREMIKNLKNDR